MADVAASVLARLKNKAAKSGRSYQLCLQLFCQEEFLRRLEKSKYAENLQNNSLDKEAINLQLQEAKKFLQDNIKGISRESDNFAQMFYYCGIIYGLDRIYNCGDYEFVKVGMEVREYIIKVQNGDMDDELEADLYDKLTKLTADDIQEVVEAIDN